MNGNSKNTITLVLSLLLGLVLITAGCSSSGGGGQPIGLPRADERGVGDSNRRVDTPPGDGDSLMDPQKRKDHESRTELSRVDTSSDASNRGFENGRDVGRGKTKSLAGLPLQGKMVEVRKRWAKIRRAPRKNSRSVALAYGNDKFQVVKTDGEWVQIRFGRKNQHKGWLPLSDLSK